MLPNLEISETTKIALIQLAHMHLPLDLVIVRSIGLLQVAIIFQSQTVSQNIQAHQCITDDLSALQVSNTMASSSSTSPPKQLRRFYLELCCHQGMHSVKAKPQKVADQTLQHKACQKKNVLNGLCIVLYSSLCSLRLL